ncbi:preprotein translocase subunit YajC [Breoghania sp. JC706]|uniref:preprotein translocase subunit YajC n=1 Tax=Breoghania sp. JC706 TaxID=3117732 RepID=UPI00300BDFD3
MFVTPAYAQTGAAAGGGELLLNILPFILIFAIMYFLIIRPQRQRMKQHQEMVNSLRRGDTIVTSGGIVGKVVKVLDDAEAQIEIAEGVKVKVVRSMIQDVRSKGEPAKENG